MFYIITTKRTAILRSTGVKQYKRTCVKKIEKNQERPLPSKIKNRQFNKSNLGALAKIAAKQNRKQEKRQQQKL